MSAFKTLQDVSDKFESEIRQDTQILISAKKNVTVEDSITKKLRDLSLISSKLKLLRAKQLTLTTEPKEGLTTANTITEYGEAAALKVIEQLTETSVAQSQAVQALITARDETLDLKLLRKKKQILAAIFRFREQDTQLRRLETMLKEKRVEQKAIIHEWNREMKALRAIKKIKHSAAPINLEDPMYKRIVGVVEKMEVIRWLLGKLLCARGHQVWMNVPQHLTQVLRLIRTENTVSMFTNMKV